MQSKINNMRIHFYGVQGSGSVFPSKAEREEARFQSDLQLLEKLFEDFVKKENASGKLDCSVEELFGGPSGRKTLRALRRKFDLPEQRVYGGWTTCIRIETSDNYDIVLDCGSGFRNCAQDITEKWGNQEERHLYVFGSHAHFDHTEGFDQAAVCFDPRNHIHVISNYEYLKALDQNLGIFSEQAGMDVKGIQTPLNYELMPSNFDSTEIRRMSNDTSLLDDPVVNAYHDISKPLILGKTTIQAFEVFHPDPCLGFRLEHNGKVFVYCTDHELRRGDDDSHPLQEASMAAEKRLREYSQNADVLYRDGQFLQVEYDGLQGVGTPIGVSRKDWGHSCVEDVMEMAEACNVKETYIGHHDPNRTWVERNWIDETLARRSAQTGLKFELAKAETVINL